MHLRLGLPAVALVAVSAVLSFGVAAAAAAATDHHLRPAPVLGGHTTTAGAAPISTGYTEGPLADGSQSFQQGPVTLGVPPAGPAGSALTLQFAGPAGPTLNSLQLSVQSGVIQAGQTYEATNSTVSFSVVVAPNSVEICGTAGNQIEVEVDQISYSNAPSPGTITSAALQVVCDNGMGGSLYGAFAYNVAPSTVGQGYYQYQQDGEISGFGNDNFLVYLGDLSTVDLNQPIVGMAITADGAGYWLVATDGGMFAYGDAQFYGSMGGLPLNEPIVGMASTPDGKGYWLVASDGGIFAFGDAHFLGSMGGRPLNKPIVGIAATPSGLGYYEVASDGGIFAFGDAQFYGSTGNITLNEPVVGMTPTPDGKGYWFVASDGGIFSYGDASFHGSTGSLTLNEPIVGMAPTPAGDGYWLVASDGGIFSFNAPFAGSLGGLGITDVAGIAT